MEKEKIEKIIKGFNSQNKQDVIWLKMYSYACKYYETYGDLLIPTRYCVEEDGKEIKLGCWIRNQRRFYHNHRLKKERIELLELIKMSWGANITKWEEMYHCAKAFYKDQGHLYIPQGYQYQNGNKKECLGDWIRNQRITYNSGDLSEDRIEKLNSIGMVWDAHATRWEETFLYAKKYFEEHGNLLVPREYTVNKGKMIVYLGKWIGTQRELYKKGLLSEEKTERLESIGMVWRIRIKKQEEPKQLIKK